MNDSKRNWRRWAPTSCACRDGRLLLVGLLALTVAGCGEPYEWDGDLQHLLASQPERFGTVLQDPPRFRVQILYTQIDRDAENRPTFRSFAYRLDPDEYFYPASTVKLPTAALALEKLRALDVTGLDRDTEMRTGDEAPGKSVGRYVREVLLVSDNQAFNRLYDFVGQRPLNDSLRGKGFAGTRIMHRLETVLSVEENRRTGPVRFLADDTVVYEQPAAYSDVDLAAPEPILLGEAEIVGGERLERPKDFAVKNAYPLQAQHDVIKALMFPDDVPPAMRFDLGDDDYAFLYRNMSGYPGESGISEYADPGRYPEGYVKFLMFGGDAPRVPDHLRIFNKVGDAYGFLTDAAYIVDFENNVEFILAATIYTNANRTFNDDRYEYDEIALPFMRDLGQAVYEVELARERPYVPDLGRFRVARD
jgi:hypothetical protein